MFYKKPIANKCVIMSNSALEGSVKRATLTQEAVRRLRNTDWSLPWSISAEIISEYSNDLRRSGYTNKFQSEVITAAIKTFEKQCAGPEDIPEKSEVTEKAMAKKAWF